VKRLFNDDRSAQALYSLVGAGLLFGCVSWLVQTGFTQAFDRSFLQGLHDRAVPRLYPALDFFSLLGGGLLQIRILAAYGLGLLALAIALSISNRSRRSGLALIVSSVASVAAISLLKTLFHRARPSLGFNGGLVEHHRFSYPSGHVFIGVVVYWRFAESLSRSRSRAPLWIKRSVWILAVCLVPALGFCRMYIGDHYPTDVIGGFLAGYAWLNATLLAERRWELRSPSAGEEAEPPRKAEILSEARK
jgi:undecaprenyl-diphosphatase